MRGNRANLYKTIKRLHEADLIAVRQTERDQLYPDAHCLYELTDEGRKVSLEWLENMLSNPRNEFPEFPAALHSQWCWARRECVLRWNAGPNKSERAWPSSNVAWMQSHPTCRGWS